MQTSPEIHELITALAQARPQFPPIVRNKTVTVKSERGAYTFSYATLDSILDAVCPILGQHGLAILCGVAAEADVVRVTAFLGHRSGQWIETTIAIPLVRVPKVQELGSLITYLKRYAINALLGIEGETDDDGNLADGNAVQPVPQGEEAPVNGHGRLPPEARITLDQARLLKKAVQSAYGFRDGEAKLRQALGFAPDKPLALRSLVAHVSAGQYAALMAGYEADLRQQVEADVP